MTPLFELFLAVVSLISFVLVIVLIWMLSGLKSRMAEFAERAGDAQKELHILRQEVRLLRAQVPRNTGIAQGKKVSSTDQTMVIPRS